MTKQSVLVRDVVGFGFLYAQLAATFWLVPDWSPAHIGEPVYLAALANVVTAAAITAIRLSGRRGSDAERLVLAVFLAGMPLIYLSSWLLAPQPGWLAGELVGTALFAALAFIGWRRSIWVLAFGIAAHGLAWDLWHYDHATFIPNWYALGCLITDVSLGIYVALQAPFFASSVGARALGGSASDQAASRRILPSASSSAR